MYDEEYDNDFGMSDDELLYREMNPEDPWYMGPSDDYIMYDYQHSVVSLALCSQKEIVMGIVYDPFHDELFSAVKGEGSFIQSFIREI